MAVPTTLNLYLLLPRTFIQEGYRTAIDKAVTALLEQKAKEDPKRVHLYYNSEDNDTEELIKEYLTRYPGISVKKAEPDFAKHKRQAYYKRNQWAWTRASSVFIAYRERPTLSQTWSIDKAEEGGSKMVYIHRLLESDKETHDVGTN